MLTKIIQLDQQLSQSLRKDDGQSPWWQAITFIAHSGDSWFWVFGLAVFWLFLPAARWLTAFTIFAIVVVAALVMAIKFSVRRARPQGDWGTVYRSTDPHSFPSGHAARCIMLAVLALHFFSLSFGLFILVWAVLVCLSRVATGMHYVSDVLAGAILGFFSALALLATQPWLMSILPFFFKPA